MRTIFALVAVLAAVAAPSPAMAGDPPPLRIGVIGTQAAGTLDAQWRPLAADLSRALGVPVVPHVSSDYAGVLWALREGSDAVAWLGNKSAIQAVDQAGAEVFARWVYTDGGAGYHSLLIVRSDSPLSSAADVLAEAGRLTLGVGDTNSTSGFLVPGYYLFGRNGIVPRQAFRRVVQGNHEDNIRAVADGRIDTATVASLVLDQLVRQDPQLGHAVRVVWRSPQIPSDPLVWRRDLPAGLKARIREFFLSYGAPAAGKSAARLAEERRVLAGLGLSRFIASDDRQLLPTRQVELYKERLEAQADRGLDPEERHRRLDAIDRDLAVLDRGGTPTD